MSEGRPAPDEDEDSPEIAELKREHLENLSREYWAEVDARYDREEALRTARRALSVAGPDGKPLFSREDVYWLRAAAETCADEGQHTEEEALRSLATRLLALLPPEEP